MPDKAMDVVYKESLFRTYYGYMLGDHWHRWFAFPVEGAKWAISHEVFENGKLVMRAKQRWFDNKKLAHKWLKRFRERNENYDASHV